MATTPETTSTANSDAQVVEQAKAEISKLIAEALKDAQKKEELVKQLKEELLAAEEPAEKVVQDLQDKKTNQHEEEGKKTLKSLTNVLEAAKKGIFLENVQNKPKTQAVLKELADKGGLTKETAAAIEAHLKDYLLGDKDIQFSSAGQVEKTQFEKDFELLIQSRPGAAELVRDAIVKHAQSDFNLNPDDVMAKLGAKGVIAPRPVIQEDQQPDFSNMSPEEQEQYIKRAGGDRELADNPGGSWSFDYGYYYNGRFNHDELDQLRTFYDPKRFIKYIEGKKYDIERDGDKIESIKNKTKEELSKKNNISITEDLIKERTEQKIMEEISKDFETNLVNMLDKVHVRLSRERASKAYEEIAQEDIYHGIIATMGGIRRAIENSSSELADFLNKSENAKYKNTLKLFIHAESKPTLEDIELVNKGLKESPTKTRIRINQLTSPKSVDASDYVKYLELIMNESIHSRTYLHNARSIYNHPAGKDGFYEGLKGYSENMTGGDLDSMLNLPDGNLAVEAFQMYDKYLDEQFALQDWKHEPSQFTTKQGGFQSHLEDEVIDALQHMHPEMTKDRLTSALYMGVGMSRGVFLNEPEKAAWADPVLTPEGGFTGASYYTNDASALMPFNPLHMYYRWQGEPNLYPFMFFPTSGKGLGQGGMYDHMKAWDLMQKYKDSYFKGRGTFKDPNVRLFIDDVIDMGKTGGVMKRGGWRKLFSNEANYIFRTTDKGVQTDVVDATRTWKTLEKVGFEIMQDFVAGADYRIPIDVLRGTKDGIKDRQELFNYVFNTYFQGEGDLNTYLHQIREGTSGGKERALNNIRDGKSAPNSLTEAIEEETSKIFLNRALARMVAQRIPTKFLRMDRDRFDKDGKSRWKRVRDELKWDSAEFDRVMKKLGLAEDMLRSDVSQQIKNKLHETGKTELKDIVDDLGNITYRLDDQKIRQLFERQNAIAKTKGLEIQFSEEDISKTIKLFKAVNEQYSGNTEFLNRFAKEIEEKKYPFSFALDELDLSLMAFRGAGARIIPRSIGDTALIEQALTRECLLKLHPVLAEIAANGKKDFSPIIQMFDGIKQAYGDVHGYELGYEVTHKIAAAVITYFKKDTMSKGILGITRFGQKNSIAAEIAGRSSAVWEWDAVDIDNFIIALESKRLIPRDQYDHSKPPKNEPIWIQTPFSDHPIKLPDKIKLPFKIFGTDEIPLFRRRIKDYKTYYSDKLRKDFGAKWYDIGFDFMVKYGPIFFALMMFKFIKDALDEAQGNKKK